MKLDANMTLGELAVGVPGAAAAFEDLGLDYCCHGARTLAEACTAAGVALEAIVQRLDRDPGMPAEPAFTDWSRTPLETLIGHILDRHHVYTRDALERLHNLLPKVVQAHGDKHVELQGLHASFEELRAELATHMAKEEQVLFPYIVYLERAVKERTPPPQAFFGTVRNPILMMMQEHDNAGELLRRLRQLSHNYVLPDESCPSWSQVYEALPALERDLHQHIHLENNVLFPRAVALEESAHGARARRE
jgi:regulator of cell morphogenesis and NO signaling